MPEYISKEEKLNLYNSINVVDGSSISKFSQSSYNLNNFQDMANKSLKVSHLEKLQENSDIRAIEPKIMQLQAIADKFINQKFNYSEKGLGNHQNGRNWTVHGLKVERPVSIATFSCSFCTTFYFESR